MFGATHIAIAFVGVFLFVGCFAFASSRGWHRIEYTTLLIVTILNGYCVVAGLVLLPGWEDVLAGASAEEVGRASVKGRGRGGIVIMAIRYWPYVLIALGGYMLYYSAPMLHDTWRQIAVTRRR
jgi:hypothetical protein